MRATGRTTSASSRFSKSLKSFQFEIGSSPFDSFFFTGGGPDAPAKDTWSLASALVMTMQEQSTRRTFGLRLLRWRLLRRWRRWCSVFLSTALCTRRRSVCTRSSAAAHGRRQAVSKSLLVIVLRDASHACERRCAHVRWRALGALAARPARNALAHDAVVDGVLVPHGATCDDGCCLEELLCVTTTSWRSGCGKEEKDITEYYGEIYRVDLHSVIISNKQIYYKFVDFDLSEQIELSGCAALSWCT